jgi:hypothetical protein
MEREQDSSYGWPGITVVVKSSLFHQKLLDMQPARP